MIITVLLKIAHTLIICTAAKFITNRVRKVLVSAHSKFMLGIARKKGEIDLQTQ